jgi:hypothetical protein
MHKNLLTDGRYLRDGGLVAEEAVKVADQQLDDLALQERERESQAITVRASHEANAAADETEADL